MLGMLWNCRESMGLETEIKQLFNKQELKNLSADDVNEALAKELYYDEYAWQYEKKMSITYPKRADGIEKPLYMYPDCGMEFEMHTEGADIFCGKCGSRRTMSEYGRMIRSDGSEDSFSHIPDWYEWEREQVIKEIESGKYKLDMQIKIESLCHIFLFLAIMRCCLKTFGTTEIHLLATVCTVNQIKLLSLLIEVNIIFILEICMEVKSSRV